MRITNDLRIYILILIIILIIIYFKNYLRSVYLAFIIPGPPAIPLLGNVLLINDNEKLLVLGNKVYELYGSICRCWVSVVPYFFIAEPQYLQVILGCSKQPAKNIFYTILHNFVGEGLITNNGHKWKLHRKLIQPYFHINVLKTFINTFCINSDVIVNDLRNKTDVNITSFMNKYVVNVLHESILGISSKNNINNSPFRKGHVVAPYRMTRPWLLFEALFNLTSYAETELKQKNNLQDYIRQILENKQKKPVNEKSNYRCLMEMFLEISDNNSEFTDEDVINETCTFMLAGQDSVGAALSFTLYFLAKHQDIQEKVMEELTAIFEKSDRVPGFSELNEMKYLEQCIKETMRLCPSVPLLSRKLTEQVVLGKYIFPKGTNILISPFATHRLQTIFPNPLQFDPDRFSPENIAQIQSYAYIPFSIGPRNCIGYKFAMLEIKVLLCEILRNYHLSLTSGHEELNLSYRITLRAKGGVWLRLKERTKK